MTDWEDRAYEIAATRYRIIAEAFELNGEGVTAAIERAAKQEHFGPEGQPIHCGERTLWRWIKRYQSGGLGALKPKRRCDAGQPRVLAPDVLERAIALRKENPDRATKTLIDILERTKVVSPRKLKCATLNRHLEHSGASRRMLHTLGNKVFKKILTLAPLELAVADFHHGPYVRLPGEDKAQKALLLVFIDHFSRYILDGRYYLHEDFAVLRHGFRRVLLVCGPFDRLYVDNGPSFQTGRFHAACKNQALNINLVHSKPYAAEGRAVCERFNRTVKEQFETEVKVRDELLTLDELNAYFEAWLAERYHQDINSETDEAPFDRFHNNVIARQAPDLEQIDELLRLRQSAKVHKNWSTVEVQTRRYLVDAALRGRRVHVLYDPFRPEYVLIEFDGRIVQRAYPQQPGFVPPQPAEPQKIKQTCDYLSILRQDYEQRTRAELSALGLGTIDPKQELSLPDLQALIISCRGAELTDKERSAVCACFRKMRPIDPQTAKNTLASARRRLGDSLHVGLYLDALQTALVKKRTKGEKIK